MNLSRFGNIVDRLKLWIRKQRGFLIRLVSLITLHELLVWMLCGRDVTAVLLSPNANTPIHWALLAVGVLGLRFLLFVVAPARVVWLLTK